MSYKLPLNLLLLFIFGLSGFILFENKALVVENDNVVLAYHLKGGGLADFHLKTNEITPLLPFADNINGDAAMILNMRTEGSKISEEEMVKRRKSIGWDLVNSPFLKGENIEMMMKADMIAEKMTVKRYIKLDSQSASFYVKEEYYNHNLKEINLNISQSIKLNPEFIDGAFINSNADLQHNVDISSRSVDLSKKTKDSEKYTWVTVTNPKKKLLMGYLWSSKDFSNVSYKQNDKIYVLSFGLKTKGATESIPSGGNTKKSYLCFLLPIHEDFKGIASLETTNGTIAIVEANVEKKRHEVVRAAEFF